MRWLILVALMVSCSEPRVYECDAFEKRACGCPNGEGGTQKCSRGPAFSDPSPPRKWKKCSCCFDIEKDDHGIYYIDQKIDAGCWSDTYDPSAESYEVVDTQGDK